VSLELLDRWSVPGAMLMAASWFAAGVIAFALAGGGYGGVPSLNWYLIEIAHAAGWVGALPALAGVHLRQASRIGRLGRVGFWAAFVGTAVLLAAYVPGILYPMGSVVAGILFLAGVLGQGPGFVLLGIGVLRARVLPAWCGWLLIAFPPFVGTFHLVTEAPGVGGVAVGLLWLLLAHGLRSTRPSVDPRATVTA
jgi:hypothetical protein